MNQQGRFIFDNRPARAEELQRLTRLSQYYTPLMEKIFQKCKQKCIDRNYSIGKIIDIGAGTGHTTVLLKKIFPQAEVSYLDTSPGLTSAAQRLADEEDCDINFITGDLYNIDTSNSCQTYDLVFSRFTLKHLFNPPLAIEKMTKTLNHGGGIILIDKDVIANTWYPVFPLYRSQFMKALNSYNNRPDRGGDSCIGRKIKYLLSLNQIVNIDVDIVQTSLTDPDNALSRQLYIEVYENLLPELVDAGLIKKKVGQKDIAKLRKYLEKENHLAITFDFIVTGIKDA